MLEVIITALEWAKANECTRFPEMPNNKGVGFSAFEAVNKALTDNNITTPAGTPLQLNKGQFTKLLNTTQLKEKGLTRFDGTNALRGPRAGGVDVLGMFGLTAAPKQERKAKAGSTAGTTTVESPVAAETPAAAPVDGGFDDFDD